MKNIITGISRLSKSELDNANETLSDLTRSFRFVHDLERLTIVAIDRLLADAGIVVPVGRDDIGLYIGIDNAVEDIKNEYFENVIREGSLGASPLLFPFTSPNALAAQATIIFDIRGESMVFPIKNSFDHVIEYADECISGNHMKAAIAGGITIQGKRSSDGFNNYGAVLFVIENPDSAKDRGIRVYENVPEVVV